MRRKISAVPLLFIVATMPAAALARDDGNSKSAFSITANATLASDYRFRGISLSDKDPAIQGGFDINHDSGLFAGTWASSIATNGGADMELDLYGGYGGSAAGIDYSMTALVYVYPGTSGLNYFEVLTSLSTSAGPATFGVDAGWVPSQNNFGGDNLYLAGKAEMPLGDTNATLFGHLGYENGDVYDNKLDWEAGISYAAGPLTASLSYVDTNYSGAKEAGRLARAGVVASITANF